MTQYIRIAAYGVVIAFAVVGFFFSLVFVGMHFGWFTVRGSIAERNAFFQATSTPAASIASVISTPVVRCNDPEKNECPWTQTPEWAAIAGGLTKDKAVIERVAQETGVSPRMLAAVVVPEQMRFFTSEREVFKRVFEPLKILGTLSQFSLGVSGIKQDTAVAIENHARDPQSAFYTGTSSAELLRYPVDVSREAELYKRLTDPKNHYYSYLYTALYIKQVEAQWAKAGYDISRDPSIVATIFNIGFGRSHPKPDPKPGGAPITTGGRVYSYGQLAGEFYASEELKEVFPQP